MIIFVAFFGATTLEINPWIHQSNYSISAPESTDSRNHSDPTKYPTISKLTKKPASTKRNASPKAQSQPSPNLCLDSRVQPLVAIGQLGPASPILHLPRAQVQVRTLGAEVEGLPQAWREITFENHAFLRRKIGYKLMFLYKVRGMGISFWINA